MSKMLEGETATVARWRVLATWLSSHRIVFDNAVLLTVGPVVAAALGFAFWWIAARSFSPEQVGLATATLSAMNMIVLTASFSLTTTMMGLPLRRMDEAPGLIAAASVFSVGSAISLWCVALLLGKTFDLELYVNLGGIETWLLITFGIVLMVLGDLADGVLTGYDRNVLRMVREVVLPVFRLALLAVLVFAIASGHSFQSLIMVGIAAELLSVGLVAVWVVKNGARWARPDFSRLKALMPLTSAHHILNLTAIGANVVMPLLVAEMLSPAYAASFYPAWMMLQIALFAPVGACMALYAIGSAEPERVAERIGLSFFVSLVLSAAAALFLIVSLDFILSLLNPLYPAIAGPALKFVGFGAIGLTIKHHYIAVMRLESRMMRATPMLALGFVTEIGGAALGAHLGGSTGFIVGWLAGVSIIALLMLPAVLNASLFPRWIGSRKTLPAA